MTEPESIEQPVDTKWAMEPTLGVRPDNRWGCRPCLGRLAGTAR